MMEFFKLMGVKTDHYYIRLGRCHCLFGTLRIYGGGIDRLAGGSYSYCCDECFARMDEKEFDEKRTKFMNDVEEMEMNKFMKTERELERYFERNGLDREKMRNNCEFFENKLQQITLDKIEIDDNLDLTFHLNENKK